MYGTLGLLIIERCDKRGPLVAGLGLLFGGGIGFGLINGGDRPLLRLRLGHSL